MRPQSVYVYYKVRSTDVVAAWDAAGKILNHVQQVTGVRGRLMHRRDEPDTWMEVYEGIADESQFDRALEAAVAASGFGKAIGAIRHTERFVPLEAGAAGLSAPGRN